MIISNIVSFVLTLVIQFFNLILTPLNVLIRDIIPMLNPMLSSIYAYVHLISENIVWVLDLLAIPRSLISYILLYFIVKGGIFLVSYIIKVVVKWWGVLW